MPLYDYDCAACGRRIEVVHGVHAPGPTHCPACGAGPLRKAISAPAVHFKGSGWAKRDRRATVPGTPKAGESDTPADAAKGDKEAPTDASAPKGAGSGDPAGGGAASTASSKPSAAGAAAKTGA